MRALTLGELILLNRLRKAAAMQDFAALPAKLQGILADLTKSAAEATAELDAEVTTSKALIGQVTAVAKAVKTTNEQLKTALGSNVEASNEQAPQGLPKLIPPNAEGGEPPLTPIPAWNGVGVQKINP